MLLCATLRVRLPLKTRWQYRGGSFTLDCINLSIGLFHLMRMRREIFDLRSFLMLPNFSCSAKYFLIESKHLGHKHPDSYSLPDSFFF